MSEGKKAEPASHSGQPADMDDVLTELNGWGKWQVIKFCYIFLTGIPVAFHNLGISFLGSTPDHWCRNPELDTLPYELQKKYGIPLEEKAEEVEYSKCLYYHGRDYSTVRRLYEEERLDEVPGSFFDSVGSIRCSYGWVYDQPYSVQTIVTEQCVNRKVEHHLELDKDNLLHSFTAYINELLTTLKKERVTVETIKSLLGVLGSCWDLVCGQSWLQATAQAIYMFGFLIGCLVFGSLSDKIGRRKTLLIVIVLMTIFGSACSFSPNYIIFAIFRFIIGSTSAGLFTTAFVYIIEVVGPEFRNRVGNGLQCGWGVGYILLPWIAYIDQLRHWQNLQLALSVWVVLFLGFYFVLPESPRWLLINGKQEECYLILSEIATTNGRKLPEDLSLKVDSKKHLIDLGNGKTREPNLLDTVRTPVMRRKSLVLMFSWFVVCLIYYGLALSSVNLGSDPYLAFFLSGLVEIPAYLITMFVMKVWGRRLPTTVTLVVGGVACLATAIPFPSDFNWVIVTLGTAGKFLITATFAVVYLYSGEIYPTVVRNVGLGSNSVLARVGAMISPYIALLGTFVRELPFIIFGGFAVVAGLLALLLPETKNKDLPETIDDGENFGTPGYIPSTKRDEVAPPEVYLNKVFSADEFPKSTEKKPVLVLYETHI